MAMSDHFEKYKKKSVEDLIKEAKELSEKPATDERIEKSLALAKAYGKKSEEYLREHRTKLHKSFDEAKGLEDKIKEIEKEEVPEEGHSPQKTSKFLIDILRTVIPALEEHGYAIVEDTTDSMLYQQWELYTNIAARTMGIEKVKNGEDLRAYINDLIKHGEVRKARDVIKEVFAHHKANTEGEHIYRFLLPEEQHEYHEKLAERISKEVGDNVKDFDDKKQKQLYNQIVGDRHKLLFAMSLLGQEDYKQLISRLKPKDYTPRD